MLGVYPDLMPDLPLPLDDSLYAEPFNEELAMKCAFVLFDRMTTLDFIGFYDAVTRLKSMHFMEEFTWETCAMSPGVTDDRGLRLAADVVGPSLAPYDVLFIPGGFGTRQLQNEAACVDWLKSAQPVPLKVSVCTGALLLGAAGFLQGKRATTHPNAFKALAPYCAEVVDERVVDSGNVITARGVSSSIDLGLYFVERLAGTGVRNQIAAQMDYPYHWR